MYDSVFVVTNNWQFSVWMTDSFYDSKTPNVTFSPWRLSFPFGVIELGGPTKNKVAAWVNTLMCHFYYHTGVDQRMVRIGTAPPFWQINHANSAYFSLFLGLYQSPSPPFGSQPPFFFLHILDPPLSYISIVVQIKNSPIIIEHSTLKGGICQTGVVG